MRSAMALTTAALSNINPEGTFPAGVVTILTIACAA